MTYEVGSYYDLHHLNKKAVSPATFQDQLEDHGQEVGTSYRFDKALRPFKVIPVVAL